MQSRQPGIRLLSFVLLLVAGVFHAAAHNPGLSTLELHLTPTGVDALMTFAPADVSSLAVLDANRDGVVSPDEFVAALPALEKLASSSVELRVDDKLLSPAPPEVEMDANLNVIFKLHFDAASVRRVRVQSLIISRLPAGHQQFVSAGDEAGHRLGEAMLRTGHDTAEFEAASVRPPRGGPAFQSFVLLGLEHIFTGYDHLLFLLGLLVVCLRFLDVIRIITCFTIAHSITLALAALEIVNIPSRVVEPAIAASIVYIGLENIWGRHSLRSRMALTFAFGLVHGFGFAAVLREMGIARSGTAVAVPLLSFNLGVELGQIAVAALLLPVLWRLHRYEWYLPRGVRALSLIIAALGAYWLVTRLA